MTMSQLADAPTRRALHAYVSDSAHSAWHDYADSQGVSASAIMQALADVGTFDPPGSDPETGDVMARTVGDHLAIVIARARRIDVARRRRLR